MEHDSDLNDMLRDRYARVVSLPASVELRKVKHYAGLSEETLAFSAEVWIDGQKAGTVENTGKGGGHSYWPHSLELALARLAEAHGFGENQLARGQALLEVTADLAEGNPATFPDADTADHNATVLTAEFFVDRLLMRHDLQAELKRRLPTTLMFVDQRGFLRRTKGKIDPVWLAGVVANPRLQGAVLEKLDARKVINFVPPAEQLGLYASALGHAVGGGA